VFAVRAGSDVRANAPWSISWIALSVTLVPGAVSVTRAVPA
jgi:multisubunit Na+/H+ antiporter MnhE subunit